LKSGIGLITILGSINTEAETGVKKSSPVSPHPVLGQYYSDQTQRPAFVRTLFDRTARHYDRINRILSLGSGNWYRKRSLIRVGLRPGMRVLDVATGTGLVARQAARVTGATNVVGLDVSFGMLQEARRSPGIGLVQASVEQLPMADAGFDVVSMGYALRHVADLGATFREFYRVLKPGGTLLILEITRPAPGLRHGLMRVYLGYLIPLLSRLTTGSREAQTLMRYYWDTIEHCVPAETILQALGNAGFDEVECLTEAGVFNAYLGRRH
jgi:demethylmenaquinone methyltransferase/2-methoxy-6-polyprenyl-1,4-benzoquinol methylase